MIQQNVMAISSQLIGISKELFEKVNGFDFDFKDGYCDVDFCLKINDMDKLEEDELKYASNDWTHIDFVIYNKMDKKMVLAIEVDGYYFHKQGTKQSERDKLKNKILSKYEIPLIRLSTIGSGEEKILEDKMKEIFGRV